jgi:hypothetical protein
MTRSWRRRSPGADEWHAAHEEANTRAGRANA